MYEYLLVDRVYRFCGLAQLHSWMYIAKIQESARNQLPTQHRLHLAGIDKGLCLRCSQVLWLYFYKQRVIGFFDFLWYSIWRCEACFRSPDPLNVKRARAALDILTLPLDEILQLFPSYSPYSHHRTNQIQTYRTIHSFRAHQRAIGRPNSSK